MLSIHVRPPEVNDRLVPGHWEGDLIKGAANRSSVGTLVCRKTLFVMLVKVDGATALDVFKGFQAAFGPLDAVLRQTLTYDQGKEMALHKKLAKSTGLKIYFANPPDPGLVRVDTGHCRRVSLGASILSFSTTRRALLTCFHRASRLWLMHLRETAVHA